MRTATCLSSAARSSRRRPGKSQPNSPANAVPARAATLRVRRTIRHARRVPLLAAVLAVALLSAAVALAASGLIQTGAPVKPLPGQRFTPTTGYGVPIAASVHLLPISVPDPAGGPRWGLRYLQTTRGLGCVEVGRVIDGRLGVLGRDGSFANDGRFHELPADVFEPLACAPLDRRGQAFIALTFHGRPASGADRFGCLPPGGPEQRTPTCPRADERVVSFGLLGPDARSLSYRVGAATRTIPIAGPLGAYLLVQPLTGSAGADTWLGNAAGEPGRESLHRGWLCRRPRMPHSVGRSRRRRAPVSPDRLGFALRGAPHAGDGRRARACAVRARSPMAATWSTGPSRCVRDGCISRSPHAPVCRAPRVATWSS